jgi:predicted PurR-regulated permease PerM
LGYSAEAGKSEASKGEKPASPVSPSRPPSNSIWEIFFRGVSSVWQVLLPLSFIPFLVYFMLTWQQHARSATVMLFSMPYRHAAYTTLGLISAMVRSFLVGNFLVGLFMSAISTVVFGIVHLPSFYVVGFVSGFLSVIPYLGVILAIAAPVIVGLGHVHSAGFLTIVVTVVALHLFSMNVLYPKFLGDRLQLNPLAVTLALLFWGGLWGAMGLILAVPVTAAMKIIFDHIDNLRPYGTWLGE